VAEYPASPLFLSIDSGLKKIRACVLDESLEAIHVEEVDIDLEMAEYGCVVLFSAAGGPNETLTPLARPHDAELATAFTLSGTK
jgi:hypothetical protein